MKKSEKIAVTALVAFALLAACVLCSLFCGEARAYTEQQEALHSAAEFYRDELGYTDDSPEIKRLQALWWEEERNAEMLTTLVFHEAAYCTERHRQLVAAVPLNRVRSPLFPDTLEEVITQHGQYAPGYADEGGALWKLARKDNEVYLSCRAASEAAMNGEVDCPDNVVWQAEFKQGDGVYEVIDTDTGWYRSTTYFCYTEGA